MALSVAASNAIVIWFLVGSILNLVLLGGLGWALLRLHAQLEQLSRRVEPLLSQANTVLTQADGHLQRVGVSASNILQHGEGITTTLEEQTQKASARISRTIYSPFVSINALLSGVSEGAKTYKTLQNRQKQKGS